MQPIFKYVQTELLFQYSIPIFTFQMNLYVKNEVWIPNYSPKTCHKSKIRLVSKFMHSFSIIITEVPNEGTD